MLMIYLLSLKTDSWLLYGVAKYDFVRTKCKKAYDRQNLISIFFCTNNAIIFWVSRIPSIVTQTITFSNKHD